MSGFRGRRRKKGYPERRERARNAERVMWADGARMDSVDAVDGVDERFLQEKEKIDSEM